MGSKILYRLGIIACIALIGSCFMEWASFEIDGKMESFTGFYSYKNFYGKPGEFLTAMAAIALALMLTPKLWAKRTNLFVCAITVGFGIRTYILFAGCYYAYCPEKKAGIFIMLASSLVMLVASVFPELKTRKVS